MSFGTEARDMHRKQFLERLNLPYDAAGRLLDRLAKDIIVENAASGMHASDQPCRPKEDAFGFQVLAEDIFATMTHDSLQTPYTLCIDGEWGVGKSSLAKFLHAYFRRESIMRKGYFSFWIDTSLIDGADRVLPFLADRTLAEALQLAKRILTDTRPAFGEGIEPLGALFLAVDDNAAQRDGKKLAAKLRQDATQWHDEWESACGKDWSLDEFQRLISSIRYGLLGRGGLSRLVWFIDDLDRCSAAVIMRMLDIHRTLLEQWGVALVYPMHMEIVISVVRKHFLEQGAVRAPYTDDPHTTGSNKY